jgi:hypothetical protein
MAVSLPEILDQRGVISAIRQTALDQTAFSRAHFVVDEAREIAAELQGMRSSLDLDDNSIVRILREKLPPAQECLAPPTGCRCSAELGVAPLST